MLGGDDTSGSIFGSRGGGTGGDVGAAAAATVSSSGDRDGSSEAAAAATTTNGNKNNHRNNSGEEDRGGVAEGERSFGGNRWPRQETLALLKIRSDMDFTFRDASVKGPLWEEVSRKLAELGYHRSAKKCREKFENVYKYHKRTKDGRSGKSEGKTYRFFDQLEALLNHSSIEAQAAMPAANPPSTTPPNTNLTSIIQPPPPTTNPTLDNISADLMSNSTSSSSTSSGIELEDRRKRKRKWNDFLERLMKEMIQKQEEMHRKFLEAIEKREHQRMVREEAWRMQEITRLNREREILAQERSVAAAKDAAVMAYLQKLTEQQNPGQPQTNRPPQPQPPPPPQASLSEVVPAAAPPSAAAPQVPQPAVNLDVSKTDNGYQSYTTSSSSRWPKVEVLALIKLRTELDFKYLDSEPKGPLWEEISAEMKKLGYNRNAKRCKEKWENINKYFKKVKESNKKRPEDSKTCPYFDQLDSLYREKSKHDSSSSNQLKPHNSVPLMVRPEQQWPPPPSEPDQHQHDHVAEEDLESEQNQDGDDEGGGFEIVASKPISMHTGE
ncbi:hypothetical protein PTKIN_Ptkin09bG0161800 [Pterospermum kingtungense]